jgi:TolB-like protein
MGLTECFILLHLVEKNRYLHFMPLDESQRLAVRTHLDSVLQSPGFRRNERLSRFLRFIVEHNLAGKDDELKEAVVAIEVFGRKPDYDPKLDSIVRTEASRLRAKLAEYHNSEGKTDTVIIELPKGGYVPAFRFIDKQPTLPERQSPRSRLRIAIPVSALIVIAAIAGWTLWTHRARDPISIAVVPLQALNRDSANEDFADGLTDEIIRNLSVIDGLAVRSRTSSFAFKDHPRNIREVGQQLQADYVIEGSVLRASDKLRVNVQLVRVRDDSPLWSARFDREVTDVFAIQDEISTGVVNQLRLQLGRGRRRYETNLDVYNIYLRGRALTNRRGQTNLRTAIDVFNQVIEKDPQFAPAFAGLADAYGGLSTTLRMDPGEAEPKMRFAAEKAVELDPLLPEARRVMGLVYERARDWNAAEKSFHRAIELDPNASANHAAYADLLLGLGRLNESVAEIRLAVKTDPLSPDVHRESAFVLISARQYEEAAAHAQTALSFEPDDPFARQFLGRARIGQSKWQEALDLLSRPGSEGFLGYAYARAGRQDEAEKLAAANTNWPNRQVLIYAGLGDRDRTFDALDEMVAVGDVRAAAYLTYPELDLVLHDSRLPSFRNKLGLPQQ